jgi:hypothetical protein
MLALGAAKAQAPPTLGNVTQSGAQPRVKLPFIQA